MLMKLLEPVRLFKLLGIALAMSLSCVAQAEDEAFRYRYIPLNQFIPPLVGYGFVGAAATGINDRRQVALSIEYCKEPLSKNPLTCTRYVGLYQNGTVQLLQERAESGPINNRGIIAGTFRVNGASNALFKKGAMPEGIQGSKPSVSTLTNKNAALMVDYTVNSHTAYLYKKNRLKTLDLKPPNLGSGKEAVIDGLHMNNREMLAGSIDFYEKLPDNSTNSIGGQAFRYNWRTGKKTFLNPLSSDNFATNVSGINDTGEVLGESRKFGEASGDIGIWDRYGKFHVYLNSLGSKDSPVTVGKLLFNNRNLIVLNNVNESGTGLQSYLVPEPKVRLAIDDLIVNRNGQPLEQEPTDGGYTIHDINNRGDIVGYTGSIRAGKQNAFLLLRIK